MSYLETLGLTRLQSRTYVSVLSLGQAKASTIARRTGIIRSEIYRTLDELTAKGLVTKLLCTPAAFRATDPKSALYTLLETESSKIEKLRGIFGEVLESLHSLAAFPEQQIGGFKLLPDRRKLDPTLANMIRNTKNCYLAVYSKWGLARVTPDSAERAAMTSAKRRGVQIRLVSEIDRSNIIQARALTKCGEVRKARGIGFYLGVMDNEEAMIGPMLTEDDANSTQSVDIWTNNTLFVQGMRALFERIWLSSTSLTRDGLV